MWVPVHDEEWDGDIPLSLNRPNRPDNDSEDGEVVFQRGTLPWQTGRYEVRPPCVPDALGEADMGLSEDPVPPRRQVQRDELGRPFRSLRCVASSRFA